MPTGTVQSSSSLVSNTRSSTTTSSLLQSTSSASASASGSSSATGIIGGGAGGPTGSGTGQPSASSTAAAPAGSGGDSGPPTGTVVGGVVGGVCGVALLIILLLLLLRSRRKGRQPGTIFPPMTQTSTQAAAAERGTTTDRSSAALPLAGAGFWRSLRPRSGQTATTTETAPSERGFQNLGGRKLESVLSTRGDGYGDTPFGAAGTLGGAGASSERGPPPPPIPIVTAAPGAAPGHLSPESLSGSSFYRDSQGFYGGPGQGDPEPPSNHWSMYVGAGSRPSSPGIPLGPGPSHPGEGIAVMRPSPARTPITSQGGFGLTRGQPGSPRGTPPPPGIPGTVPETSLRPRDGVGRSHPSLDGSRGSRFHEDV